jgi:hypothetical protein
MVDDAFIPIFAIFVGLVVAALAIRSGQRQRIAKLRYELYVKMLESGRVTKEEMEEMLHGIGGEGRGPSRRGAEGAAGGPFIRLLVGVGWLGLMTALGLLVASFVTVTSDSDEFQIAAAIVGAVSLGFIGLPIGIRELAGSGSRSRGEAR